MVWYPISFRGTAREYLALIFKGTLLTLIALGGYYPFYAIRKRAWITSHVHFGNVPFAFDGTGKQLLKIYLQVTAAVVSVAVMALLTAVLLSRASPWLAFGVAGLLFSSPWFFASAERQRLFWNHTLFREGRGHFPWSGSAKCVLSKPIDTDAREPRMRTLAFIIMVSLTIGLSMPPAFADNFEGIIHSELRSKGKTVEVVSYFKDIAVRMDISMFGTKWVTVLIDATAQTGTVVNHIAHSVSRHTFDEWKAVAKKKARKERGPLRQTRETAVIAGYRVKQYVHSHADGISVESWATSDLLISPPSFMPLLNSVVERQHTLVTSIWRIMDCCIFES